jgi:hypothetical protein
MKGFGGVYGFVEANNSTSLIAALQQGLWPDVAGVCWSKLQQRLGLPLQEFAPATCISLVSPHGTKKQAQAICGGGFISKCL